MSITSTFLKTHLFITLRSDACSDHTIAEGITKHLILASIILQHLHNNNDWNPYTLGLFDPRFGLCQLENGRKRSARSK